MKLFILTFLYALAGAIACWVIVYWTAAKSPPAPTWYEQTCLNCGQVWDCSEPGPETMPWCAGCGKFCWAGYNLFQNVLESKGSPEAQAAMVKHCRICVGCRGALYSPESWQVEIRNQMEILYPEH